MSFNDLYLTVEAEDRTQELRKSLEGWADNQQKKEPVEQKEDSTFKTAAKSVGEDIGRGVIAAPRRIARGFINALQEVGDIGGDIERALDLPILQITNDAGEFDLELARRSNLPDVKNISDVIFDKIKPDLPKKPTFTGQAIETLAQFFTGFKGVDKVVKAVQGAKKIEDVSQLNRLIKTATKGAAADALVFDEQESRLSNLIQQVPGLENPVTEYLQADESDSLVEGKLKQAIEGFGLGAVTDGLLTGIKAVKKFKKVKESNPELFDVPEQEASGVGITKEDFVSIGDPDQEAFILSPREVKARKAIKETDGVIPEEVSKREFEINFSRIEGSDDVKNLMDQMVNNPKLIKSIQEARRGVRDESATLTAANDIDGFDTMMNRRQGEAFNAEQIIAARKVYYDTTEKLMETAKRAASPQASTIDHFNFRKMIAVHHAVQKEFMGVRAEAGRALQAWRINIGGTAAENLRQVEETLTQYGGTEASTDLARRLTSVGNNINTSQINEITKRAASARTLDAVTEAWTLGLLTNPATHVTNLSSNILTSLMLGVERAFAGLNKESAITTQEASVYFMGLLQAQKEAIKNSALAFKTGQTGFGLGKIELPYIRSTSQEVLDAQGVFKPFGKALDLYGKALGLAGNALAAGDEYSKTVLYKAQLKALAMREGLSQGLDGEDLHKFVAANSENPSNMMKADAVQFANYGTFTNELGRTGQAIQRTISRNPALRFVAPFIRTPTNIFKFTFSRTPLGLLSENIRNDIRSGGVKRDMALSRMAMGSSIMWIGTDLSLNGQITGGGPTDQRQRSALRRTGWQPYSIKVGDTYLSYGRMEPIGTILGLSADISEIMSNYESYDMRAQDEVDELVTASVMAIGNQVVGKTFMTGFADLVEVLSDPGRYGESYVQKFAGSFIPAGVAGIERALTPEIEFAFNTLDKVKSRIPGMSKDVPKRLNVYGEEIKTFYPDDSLKMAKGERVLSLFNPFYYSNKKSDSELDEFFLRNGFHINMPQKTQRFDGVNIDLSEYPEIYHRLVQLRAGIDLDSVLIGAKYGGETLKQRLLGMVKRENLSGMVFFSSFTDADEQQNFINSIVTDYQKEAKKQLIEEYPVLDQIISEEKNKLNNLMNRGALDFMGDL